MFEYKKESHVGKALILSVTVDREGAREEAENAHSFLTILGYSVVLLLDPTSADAVMAIRRHAQGPWAGNASCVLCVMAHSMMYSGTQFFRFSDGKNVALNEISRQFLPEKAPQLTGKPKILYVQACRDNPDATGKGAGPIFIGARDFAIIYSSLPTLPSYRNGFWSAQYSVLESMQVSSARKLPLLQLAAEANARMAKLGFESTHVHSTLRDVLISSSRLGKAAAPTKEKAARAGERHSKRRQT